jgi:hypothetical protein
MVTRDELYAQLALEIPDLPRKRWLRQPKSLGGAHESALFGDCQEVPEVTQIHRKAPSRKA